MPYVARNIKDEVIAIYQDQGKDNRQWEEADSPDVIAFIKSMDTSYKTKQMLSGSDSGMARVIEDLIDILMEKQIFVYTELPEAVQAKLSARKQLRQNMSALGNLINEDDNIF
jgi:hypothetical protein